VEFILGPPESPARTLDTSSGSLSRRATTGSARLALFLMTKELRL
jgi:hypothetical protein